MWVGRPRSLTPEKLDMAHRLLAEGKGRAHRMARHRSSASLR